MALPADAATPAESARLVGLSGTPTWWRNVFLGGFLAVLALALWRTARGADWRDQAGWATLALLLCTAWLLGSRIACNWGTMAYTASR